MSEETKAVAKTTAKKPAVKEQVEMNYPALFEMAMSNERGLDIIKELTALKNAEEDRQAKKDFDIHYAEMQAELKPVLKSKEGSKTNSGEVAFKYAPIEYFQEVNDSVITKHGFSYKWTEEPREKGELRVRIHISGYGYTDSNTYTDIPPIATNSLTTAAQARGAQKGYGRRITYVDGFGMTAVGEDTDGSLSFEDGVKYGDMYLQFAECKTVKEAHDLGQKYYRDGKTERNDEKLAMSKKLYAKRKAELNG